MKNKIKLKKIFLSPFIHSNDNIQKVMIDVIISLLPAIICSIYYFGFHVIVLLISSITSAIFFEWISRKIMKKENSIWDCSAIVTAILFTLTLPPLTSFPLAILGSFIAIVLVKQLFGGLGYNIFNPAIAARGILLISFSVPLTTWTLPFTYNQELDAIVTSTPLTLLKEISKLFFSGNNLEAINLFQKTAFNQDTLWSLFTGNTAGSLGETSIIALIIGAIYLIFKKRIHIEIPLIYLSTSFFIAWIIGFVNKLNIFFPILHILSGGLFLGAIFMATDWVTKPLTKKSRIIYAIFLGILTMIIRFKGNYPEGVLFSILIMNMFVPLLDNCFKNKIFGKKNTKGESINEKNI